MNLNEASLETPNSRNYSINLPLGHVGEKNQQKHLYLISCDYEGGELKK